MKAALGIIVILVLALGVWLSLHLGQSMPVQQTQTPVATTTEQSSVPAGWQEYRDPQGRFTIDYPQSFTAAQDDKGNIKFVIDPAMATGTNLATDSNVSVETLAAADCKVASSTGAGAGNRYEEWVYPYQASSTCFGVHYLIHYGVLENYPKGSVKAFDGGAVLAQFDAIRNTFKVIQ